MQEAGGSRSTKWESWFTYSWSNVYGFGSLTISYTSDVIMIAKLRFVFWGSETLSHSSIHTKWLSISNVLSVGPGNSQREGEESRMLGTNSYWYHSEIIMRVNAWFRGRISAWRVYASERGGQEELEDNPNWKVEMVVSNPRSNGWAEGMRACK